MRGRILVDPDGLSRAAAEFDALHAEASRICSLAGTADPSLPTMGIFSTVLHWFYPDVVSEAHQHLGMVRDGLSEQAGTLRSTHSRYEHVEATNTQDFRSIGTGTPADPTGMSVSAGPIDVLRFDPGSDIPLVSSVSSLAASFSASADGITRAEIGDLTTGIAELGGTAASIYLDPLNYLISAGLGFLVDVVQPLQDILDLVTGNPEWTAAQAEVWRQVAIDLRALGVEVSASADRNLPNWTGDAADAARQKIGTFAGGIGLAAQEIDHLATLLEALTQLMETAEALILSLISAFVEWLILVWIAAIATSYFTGGTSTVAAALTTQTQAGLTTTRAATILDRVAALTERLGHLLKKLKLKDLKKIYADGFAGDTYPAGRDTNAFNSIPRTLWEQGLKSGEVSVPALVQVTDAVATMAGHDPPPESDIERALRGEAS